jgi:hypothetical protein
LKRTSNCALDDVSRQFSPLKQVSGYKTTLKASPILHLLEKTAFALGEIPASIHSKPNHNCITMKVSISFGVLALCASSAMAAYCDDHDYYCGWNLLDKGRC